MPQRTVLAALAARADVLAGFTAERDMGTEGAGSADTAVMRAIDEGLIPGPRLRISGNAIDILGGHEDANRFNPAQHVLSNADYANTPEEIVATIRQQHKQGSTFVKMYETGPDTMVAADATDHPPVAGDAAFWSFHTPYQYTEAELRALEQHHVGAAELGQMIGNRTADDAPANDDDAG